MAQMKNKRVLILERHFKPGGFTQSFTRPGHGRWDVGLNYVGDMAPDAMGRQLFDLITKYGVKWKKMPSPYEKFVYPDFTFDVPDNEDAYQQALIKQFHNEHATIRQYFKDIHTTVRWFGTHLFAKFTPPLIGNLYI